MMFQMNIWVSEEEKSLWLITEDTGATLGQRLLELLEQGSTKFSLSLEKKLKDSGVLILMGRLTFYPAPT